MNINAPAAPPPRRARRERCGRPRGEAAAGDDGA